VPFLLVREYDKAVSQANRLAEMGFAQVYLFVIVVVDSRENNQGRYTYEGSTPDCSQRFGRRFLLMPSCHESAWSRTNSFSLWTTRR
jgi:hypothetical protein